MIFIFGVGYQTSKTNEMRNVSHCSHCGNARRWILGKKTTWFSLFFVPLIPVKNEYLEYCPVCGQGNRLSHDEYENKMNLTL